MSRLADRAIAFSFCRKARRKEKDAGTTEDPKLYLEEAALERQLPELDLRMLVDLPPGLDYNEWLASHTLALFDHINLVYGTISEFCTMTGCPDMTGPGLRYARFFSQNILSFEEVFPEHPIASSSHNRIFSWNIKICFRPFRNWQFLS